MECSQEDQQESQQSLAPFFNIMFGLLAIVLVSGLSWFQFWKHRHLGVKRPWFEMTKPERQYLALGAGTSVQLLLVTMLPGWIVAATIVGKGEFAESHVGAELWGLIMATTNTILYTGLAYLALGKVRREPEVESLDL